MKNIIKQFVFILAIGMMSGFISCDKDEKQTEIEQPSPEEEKVVKVLAIGNSFSEDALEGYLYELAEAADKTIVIGNLYIGGATLTTHWENASADNAAYQYRKIDREGRRTNERNIRIRTAIMDEEWDYIVLQQASSLSGRYVTYRPFLTDIAKYVEEHATNPNMALILHQVWAYAQHSTHNGFANYDNDQLTMYKAIVETVERAKDLANISFVVPTGTAIQNGRTSAIGDRFDRDGYHLDLGIGRYTAACVWFEALFDESVLGNSYRPTDVSPKEAEIAQNAAHRAMEKPNEISEMADYK
ncbi:DUF4886 domain-containing protein [Sphingobacterium chuzhouense]|nr:DUF4886 domain-containing protein [Sphingobacterium chuzhouense]